MDPESSAERMVSKEIIKVKDAPDMNLMESVRHFTFLLSKRYIKSVKGGKMKQTKKLKAQIERFSSTINVALEKYYSEPHPEAKGNDNTFSEEKIDLSDRRRSAASSRTADAAADMLRASVKVDSKRAGVVRMTHITKVQRDKVIHKAKACLAWAHDPERKAVPGAGKITKDQVR